MKTLLKKMFTAFLLLTAGMGQFGFTQENDQTKYIAAIRDSLQNLIRIQRQIEFLHPFLKKFQPVVFLHNQQLFIFDYDSLRTQYRFIKTIPLPFSMPEGIRASFPLEGYNFRPVCIVSDDIFDSRNGYVTIFHEFMHCMQYLSGEQELKQNLRIAREAAERNDYSWEINYPFPYQDSLFRVYYSGFLEAVGKNGEKDPGEYRQLLKAHLSLTDFEYMVWEEWKEGFARWIENRIQSELGLQVNVNGNEKPYNRTTFYYGGEEFIDYLVQNHKNLATAPELLFDRMMNF